MATNVGSVSVRVVPDASQFVRDLRRDLDSPADRLGKELGQKLGAEAGNGINQSIRDSLGNVDSRDLTRSGARIGSNLGDAISRGVGQGFQRGVSDARRQLDSELSGFAKEVNKRVTNALSVLPSKRTVTFDVNTSELEKALTALRALQSKRVGIDIMSGAAIADANRVLEKLREIERTTARAEVKADIRNAIRELESLRRYAQKAGDDSGREYGGAFERTVRQALTRAGSSINIRPEFDGSQINTELANIQRRMEALRDRRIGVDIDSSGFESEYANIRSRLAQLASQSADINVRADASAALAELYAVNQYLERLDGTTARANVTVDDGGTAYAVDTNVSRLLNRLLLFGSAAGGISSVIGPMLALGAASGVAGAAVGAASLAFGGIGDAVKALSQQQTEAARTGQDLAAKQAQQAGAIANAQARVAQATRQAGNVRAQVAEQAARAAASVRDAEQRLAAAREKAAADDAKSANAIVAAQGRVAEARETAALNAQESAARIASAVANVAKAERTAAENAIRSSQSIRNAREAVQQATEQATRNVAAALDRAEKAEGTLADAQRDAVRAQDALNDARKSASRDLLDMRDALAGNVLSQRRNTLDLIEAEQELQRVRSDPSATDLQRARAQLAYDEALQQSRELRREGQELGEDYAEASRKGVNGSDEVVAAQERVRDATGAITAAQAELAQANAEVDRARRDGAREVAQAQEALANAERDAAQQRRDDLEAISEAQAEVGQAQAAAAKQARDDARSIAEAQANVREAEAARAQQARDSARQIRDAEEALADARRQQQAQARQGAAQILEADENIRDAQRQLQQAYATTGDTGKTAADKVAEAFANLSPAAADFARYLFSLKPLMDSLRATSAANLFPALTRGMQNFLVNFEAFRTNVGRLSASTGIFAERLLTHLGSQEWMRFWDRISLAADGIALRAADSFNNAGLAVAAFFDALLPVNSIGFDALDAVSAFFRDFAQYTPGIAVPLTAAFIDMLKALSPLGPALVALAVPMAELGRILSLGVGAALIALIPMFEALGVVLGVFADIIAAIPEPLRAILVALIGLQLARVIFSDMRLAARFARDSLTDLGSQAGTLTSSMGALQNQSSATSAALLRGGNATSVANRSMLNYGGAANAARMSAVELGAEQDRLNGVIRAQGRQWLGLRAAVLAQVGTQRWATSAMAEVRDAMRGYVTDMETGERRVRTFEEAQQRLAARNAATAESAARIGAAFANTGDRIASTFVDPVTRGLDRTGRAFMALPGLVRTAVDGVGLAMTRASLQVDGFGERTRLGMDDAARSVGQFGERVRSSISGALGPAMLSVGAFTESVRNSFRQITSSPDAFLGAVARFNNGVDQMAANTIGRFNDMRNQVGNAVGTMRNRVEIEAVNAANAIGAGMVRARDSAVTGMASVRDAVIAGAVGVRDAATRVVTEGPAAIRAGLDTARASVVTGMASMRDAVTSGLSSMGTAIGNFARADFGNIRTAVDGVSTAIRTGFSGIGTVVESGIGGARRALQTFGDTAGAAARGGVTLLRTALVGTTTGGGLMGALGGPWGLVIMGAIAGLGFLADAQAKSAQKAAEHRTAIDNLRGSLDQYTGAVTQATIEQKANEIAAGNLDEIAQRFGINLGDVTRAMLGQGDALSRVNTQLMGHAQRVIESSGVWKNYQMELQATGLDMNTLQLAALGNQDAIGRVNQAISLAGGASTEFGGALTLLLGHLQNNTGGLQQLGLAIGQSNNDLRAAQTEHLNARAAIDGLRAATDAARGSMVFWSGELNRTNGVFTAVGPNADAFRQQLNGISGAARDSALAAGELATRNQAVGGSAIAVRDNLAQSRAEFIRNAEAAGISRVAAENLANQYGLIPSIVTTQFNQLGVRQADEALQILQGRISSVDQTTGTVRIDGGMTQAEIDRLRHLGFVVETLPGGVVTVTSNTVQVESSIAGIIGRINGTVARMGIHGDPLPANATLQQTVDFINRSKGTAGIHGDPLPANATTQQTLDWINRQWGFLNEGANTTPAEDGTRGRIEWINGQWSFVRTGANTDPAQRDVDARNAQIQDPNRQPVLTPRVDGREADNWFSNFLSRIGEGFRNWWANPFGWSTPAPPPPPPPRAMGAIDRIRGMATGGIRGMAAGYANVVAPNTPTLIGDRKKDDEAYIPINNSSRSVAILTETAARMGFALQPMASGGIVGMATGGVTGAAAPGAPGSPTSGALPFTAADVAALDAAIQALNTSLAAMQANTALLNASLTATQLNVTTLNAAFGALGLATSALDLGTNTLALSYANLGVVVNTQVVPALTAESLVLNTQLLPAYTAAATTLSTLVIPAITAQATTLTTLVIPALTAEATTLTTLVIPALTAQATTLTTLVVPAMTAEAATINGVLIPALVAEAATLNVQVIPALTAHALTLTTQVIPALTFTANTVNAALIPALATLALTLNAQVTPALVAKAATLNLQVIPALVSTAATVNVQVIPALVALAGTINVQVIPALSAMTLNLNLQVVPALLSLTNTVNISVIPALMALASQINIGVIPALLGLANQINLFTVPALANLATTINIQVNPALLALQNQVNLGNIPAFTGLGAATNTLINTALVPLVNYLNAFVFPTLQRYQFEIGTLSVQANDALIMSLGRVRVDMDSTAINVGINSQRMRDEMHRTAFEGGIAMDSLRNNMRITQDTARFMADVMGIEMGRIRGAVADPIRWTMQFPLGPPGLAASWNALDDQFKLGKRINPPAPNFRTGGMVGYANGGRISGTGSGTQDNIPIMASTGEFVVREKIARQHKHFLSALNEGQAEARQAAGGSRARMKNGGTVGRRPMKNGLPAYAPGGVIEAVQRAQAFAQQHAGRPYVWAASGPGGFDCSGWLSAVTHVLRGDPNPYRRIGATGNFPWPGFAPGMGAFTIGSFTGNPGHMAGTVGGQNTESRGGRGVLYGPAARGADNPMFRTRAQLAQVGGQFVSGGPGGGPGGGGGFDPTPIINEKFAPAYKLVDEIVPRFGNTPYVGGVQGAARSTVDTIKGKATEQLVQMFGAAGGAGGGPLGPLGAGAQFYVAEISRAAKAMGLGKDAAIIGVATALVETGSLRMLANRSRPDSLRFPHDGIAADHDSVGLFQQRANGAWGTTAQQMNAFASASMFFAALARLPWRTMQPGMAAQAVQRSAFPGKYQTRMAQATQLVNQWGGFDEGGLATGVGFMPKFINEPERVLSPQQTRSFDTLVRAIDEKDLLKAVATQPQEPARVFNVYPRENQSEMSIAAAVRRVDSFQSRLR